MTNRKVTDKVKVYGKLYRQTDGQTRGSGQFTQIFKTDRMKERQTDLKQCIPELSIPGYNCKDICIIRKVQTEYNVLEIVQVETACMVLLYCIQRAHNFQNIAEVDRNI